MKIILKFWGFITSKVLLLNIILSILVIIGVVKLCLFFLNSYSHHGEKIVVPNLTNMSYAEATIKLNDINLNCQIKDSSYHRNIRAGYIIKQQPLPKSFVKRNRTIKLTIATKEIEKVSLHTTKDMSLRQAINMFNRLGLHVNKLQYQPSSFSNLVLGFKLHGKTITKEDKILKNTKVDIIIGKRYGLRVVSPRLKNKTLYEATLQLHNAGLNLGDLYFDEDVDSYADSIKATVFKQSISPGLRILPGEAIDLHLRLQ